MNDDDHETHDEYLDRQEEHELDAADARVADLLDRALVAEDRAMRIQETLGDARVDLLVVTAERDEARRIAEGLNAQLRDEVMNYCLGLPWEADDE